MINIGLHLETFLYMVLQSDRALPPPGPRPDFDAMARKAVTERVENRWIKVPANRITHGFDDPENDEGPDRFFAWDNERPPYKVEVHAFEAQARPISNGEYAEYLAQVGGDMPMTWISRPANIDNAEAATGHHAFIYANTFIKTVYGPVSLKLAADWPVMASYNECQGYAKWVGHRIPTFDEVRSICNFVEKQKSGGESDAPDGFSTSSPDPEDIFVDLTGCNTGLQHFHPMPVTQNGHRPSGHGDMGGAWEWTSTLLAPFEKFKPMDMYPGYTGWLLPHKLSSLRTLNLCKADFMDGKHNIVLGGSWATHPRITGRKSL